MTSYRKVFQYGFEARCSKCNTTIKLTKDSMKREVQRRNPNEIPLKARSSNMTVLCPKCHHNTFRVDFKYKNEYRRHCKICGNLFNTYKSWEHICKTCRKKEAEAQHLFGK